MEEERKERRRNVLNFFFDVGKRERRGEAERNEEQKKVLNCFIGNGFFFVILKNFGSRKFTKSRRERGSEKKERILLINLPVLIICLQLFFSNK
jgi:hypothetical protein